MLELLLHLGGEQNDMLRRSGPKDETVSLVFEAGLNGRVRQAQEILVNDELFKVCGEELFFLLGVALYTMSLIQRLNLGLNIFTKECVSLIGVHAIYSRRNGA